MSSWELINPSYATQIRVNRGLYYHHGIYLDDNCVVQFGGTDSDNVLDPSKAKIIITSLDTFLKGGILEVRVLEGEELNKVRKPQDIANYALSRLGEGGYDLINNNCEHFANECLFGVKESNQVENVFAKLSSLFNTK